MPENPMSITETTYKRTLLPVKYVTNYAIILKANLFYYFIINIGPSINVLSSHCGKKVIKTYEIS